MMARVPLSSLAESLSGITDTPCIVQLRLLAYYINSGGSQAGFADGIDFEDDMDLSETLYTVCDVWSATNYLKGSIVYKEAIEGYGYVFYCHTNTEDSDDPIEDVFIDGDGFTGNYWIHLYSVNDFIGTGYTPIGIQTYPLISPIYGNRFKVKNLYCNMPSTSHVGLIGATGAGCLLSDLILTDATIYAKEYCGSLVGGANNTTISNCQSYNPTVTQNTTNAGSVGGVIGGFRSSGECRNSFGVNVLVTGHAGGRLVGGFSGDFNNGGTDVQLVENCFSTGSVTGGSRVGGFVGVHNEQDSSVNVIQDCYSRCSVIGLGTGDYNSVTDGSQVGGFSGRQNRGTEQRCYSTGAVSSVSPPAGYDASGFVGFSNASPTQEACYWDTEASGKSVSGGGEGIVGKTTLEMQQLRSIAPWDFVNVWQQRAGLKHNDGYPSPVACDGRIIKRRREPAGQL